MTATVAKTQPKQAGKANETTPQSMKRTVTIPSGMPFRPLSDPENRAEHTARKKKKSKKAKTKAEAAEKVTKPKPEPKSKRPPLKRKRKPAVDSKPLTAPETESPKGQQSVAGESESADESNQVGAGANKERTELEQLVVDAKLNKPDALNNLRQFLENNEAVYRKFGDLAAAARYGFAKLSCPDSPLQCESIFRRAEETLAKYLPEGTDSPTESILAQQIVVCSMRVNYFDYQSSNYATCENVQFVTLLLRKHEIAQNQLFKAISKLQEYRRLKSL
jgi:hypothetical protein